MNNVKHGIAHRLLAAFMALMLVFGMIPVSTVPVYAATTEHPDAVTISVVDAEGNPIEGASVSYTINSVANGDAYITDSKTTDEYGVVEVLGATEFVADDFTLSATIAKDGYVSGNVASTAITSADQNFSAALTAVTPAIDNVTITETPWTYDGEAHTLVSVVAQEGDVVTYKLGDGEVSEAVPTATNAGTYTVIVYVARAGHETLEKTVSVEVAKASIPVVLTAKAGLVYDGNAQDLVTLSGVEDADTITWTVNEEATGSENIPVGTAAKTYTVTVSVDRNDPNYNVFTDTVTVEIAKANIEGVTLEAITGLAYTGTDQALVTLSGVEDSDVITWTVNEEATGSEDIPARLAVGTYNIVLTVDRGENYNVLTIPVTAEIKLATISLGDLIVKGLNSVFTGEAQKVVTVENAGNNYTLWYQIAEVVNGEPVVDEDAWTTEIPTVTNAGSYVVLVKAVQTNHSDKEVVVTPAADAVTPYNVYVASQKVEKPTADNTVFVFDSTEKTYNIAASSLYTVTGNKQTNAGEYTVVVSLNDKANYAWADGTTEDLSFTFIIDKASQSLTFNNSEYTDGGSKNVTISGTATYDFGTTKVAFDGNEVVYSLGEGTDDGIAQISADGIVTVTDAGTVIVVATLAGNENYYGASISYTLEVTEETNNENKLIYFTSGNVSYIFGEANGAVSAQAATKRHQRDNNPTYSINNTDIGLTIDNRTGAITVSDFAKLGEALAANNGSVVVTVTANKAEVKRGNRVLYEADTASYTLTISFMATPDSAYVLSGTKGTIDAVDTNWYVSAVTAVPADAEAYTISKTLIPSDFDANSANAVEFSNQGSATRYVYLRSKTTGGITAAIPVNVNIDTEISKPTISYSTGVGEALLEMLTFGFYNPDVTVTVELTDVTSGIDHFDYSYAVQEGASATNVGGSGVITSDNISYENGKATASFKIPAQFRGYVTVVATDKAGNTAQTADEKVVVVDSIAPGITVSYDNNSVSNGKYYSEARTATITITEANFFADDLNSGNLVITVEKTLNDGTYTKEDVKPEFTKNGDVYTATILFNENADYTFDIKYTDRSGNVFDSYAKDEFTVDLTDPVIEVVFDNNSAINGNQFKADRTATITVTEHNFVATGFVATVNGTAKELEWDDNGDVHTTTIEFPGDAHYTLNLACTDLSGRIDQDGADYGESVAPTEFTVDKTAPTDLTISYNDSVLDAVLEALSFGFYNSTVTVTVEAVDPTAGVDYFTYSYTVQEGASATNTGKADVVISADDIVYENGKATATFEIPAQFRGCVYVKATDRAGNYAETADEKVVVVDDVAPGITVSYDNNSSKNGKYFDADRTATITITEANFFAADLTDLVPGTEEEYLVITVGKTLYDGTTTTTKVKPDFTKNGDVYTATIKFDENADYTFDIKYTDRAGNVYDSYEMDVFTIDKIQPKISVSYNDTVAALNGNYYKADREVVFTVVEHNFRASDIDFTISATDVTGTKVVDLSAKGYAAYLQNQSNWTKSGDTWTATITLDIEGNYTIGMKYADMAGDPQENEISDAFCIDKTIPAALTVSYSESVLDTVLETLTFGFYKAPVTVTITATDEYAGVDYFTYSYAVDADASDINTGKTDVVISSDDITYDGNKATATFEIPAQYRGHVSFVVTDKAGNSNNVTAEEVIVVDDKAPVVEVTYDNNNALYDNYYDADRTATITITEANFFAADQADGYLVITVGKTLNDGTHTETVVQPAFTSNGDVHTATVKFDENADYTFDIKYTDRSGNVFDSYEMDEFTIDKIAPVIDITYSNNTAKNNDQFQADRVATIVITEHNFKASDVAATVMASVEPFNGAVSSESYKLVESYTQYLADDANWKHEGDVHTAVIEYTEEAHYTFTIAYSDMAGNDNVGVNYSDSVAPEKFTLDKSAPTELAITIDEVSVLDEDNSVTFDKFYPEQIAIKLAANCDISGLETLQYQKVNAVSDYVVNGTWTAYDAEKGIVVDPSEKLVIFFRAEDRAGNVTIVNSTGIVVDDQMPIGETNAPEIDILPAAPNANGLHKGNVVVDLKVVDPRYAGGSANEAGFYSGLNKITYRIYTTDTDEVEEGVLLDLIDVTEGAVYDGDNLVSSWSGKITIDSTKFNSNNVVVEVSATDNAGNVRTSSTTAGDIQIDITAPQIDISYNNNNPDSGSYYNADRTATITITERNFDAKDVVITITNTDNVIPDIPAELLDWKEVVGTGNKDNTTYTATIVYSADGDYKFGIDYTDEAENVCPGANYAANTQNATEFTIDKTNPVIRVDYNNNDAENGKYFDATRTATITITEHNFVENRVIFTRNAARGGTNPNIAWTHNGDTHIATISYTTDGDYTFDVTMTDMAGNNSGAANYGNSVAGKDFVIDTTFEDMITIGGVESGKAYGYSDDVIPTIDISDINLEKYTVTLVGVQKDTTIDLTKEVNELLNAGTENVTGTFDIFEVVQDMDGIYTLSVTSQDKAGNQDAEEITFTVNRFGSVYVYDQYLVDLISNGGAYILSVTDDLIIVEYNADKLVSDSLVIEITCDGKPLENVIYEVTPEINDRVAVGESGWYQYKYTISKDNFASDGVYKISVSSKDATGNTPENNRYEDLGITFRVDSTLAEISSIVGLEEAIINATEQVVKYTVYDTMGIKSIKVYVDGQLVDEITDFSADLNNYSGSFTLTEQSAAQSIRIVVEDMSGNITDTDAETFSSAYEFNKSVTVSTNIFVRWYANKPLFWGSIGGVTVVAAGLWIFLAAKRKKKEEATA